MEFYYIIPIMLAMIYALIKISLQNQCSKLSVECNMYPADSRALQASTYRSITVYSHVVCGNLCHSDMRCQSINYYQTSHLCELNNASRAQYPDNFITHYGSVYFDADVETPLSSVPRYSSCQKLLDAGHDASDIYTIFPAGFSDGLTVYCDMDTDGVGWIVIQRRQDGSVDFYRNWTDYQVGFGNLSGEFWLGNDNLRTLTESNDITWKLHICLEDWDNNKMCAVYEDFGISGELYTLQLSSYNANDSTLVDSMLFHNNHPFTTKDQDHDNYETNCAIMYEGAWWYDGCYYANLNGKYYHYPDYNTEYGQGIQWREISLFYSYKTCDMKIRIKTP